MALKDKVFEKLNHAFGHFISGQTLAEDFGVSRNAVWKAVKALEQDGVDVESVHNRGYRLNPNALVKSRIESVIPDGIKLFLMRRTDSTNSEAKRLLAGGFCGTGLVVADEQTGGRGRLGRSFYSPPGSGVYMSLIIKPGFGISDAVFITTAASVAVVRAIEKLTDKKPQIKWVNDIYIHDKKVCGILTEAVTDFESGSVESVVIGIGINLYSEAIPDEIKNIAAGLDDESVNRTELIGAVITELSVVLSDLKHADFMEEYREHSLVTGKKITYTHGSMSGEGIVTGIDDFGGLTVETEHGEITLRSGEISVRLGMDR